MGWFKKALPFALTAFIAFGAGVFALALLLRPQPLAVGELQLAGKADGEYVGVCQNKILTAVVKVKVANEKLAQVDVLEHKASYLPQARQTAQEAVERQSLQVDAVSGATLTSTTVLKAIENAIR